MFSTPIKKILLIPVILFIFFVLSSFFSHSSFAQSSQVNYQANPYLTPNTNPDVPQNMHTYTQNIFIELMSASMCQLSGFDPVNPNQKCLGVDMNSGKIGFVEGGGGAVGIMAKMIGVLYTPPAHAGDYFADLGNNFGFAKKTYAQTTGVGFNGLRPLMDIWSAFRNIVYLLFVLFFMIIGIAIMLRIKIDPRTVMTIENQIPKLIIGIILVTFSFAIAGFLIDLMYVVIYFVFGVISGIPNSAVADLNPALMQGRTPMEAVSGAGGIHSIANNIALSTKDVFQNIVGIKGCADAGSCLNNYFNPLQPWTNMVFDPNNTNQETGVFNWLIWVISAGAGSYSFFQVIHTPTTEMTTPIIGDIVNFLTGYVGKGIGAAVIGEMAYSATQYVLRALLPYLIIYIIVFIALLGALIRLWFTLIMAYINILLDVVLAPFWIVAGSMPGGAFGVGAWLRDLISNLAVFPTVIAMFLLAKVFMDRFANAPQGFSPFLPPLVGNPTGSEGPKVIGSLIGFGFILLTPKAAEWMKSALKAPKFDISPISKGVGFGAGVFTSPLKWLGGAASFAGGQKLMQRILPGAPASIPPAGGDHK